MAAPTVKRTTSLCLLLISLLLLSAALQISGQPAAAAGDNNPAPAQCAAKTEGACHNKARALKLKIIAFFSILFTSVIGVSLPILTRAVPALHPEKNLFTIVKALASGVILATGYMHVLPDSFDDLRSECLPENPWRKFPFTTFVAMLSALLTLMVDSFGMALYNKKNCCNVPVPVQPQAPKDMESELHSVNGQSTGHKTDDPKSHLLRYRVVAQVLELGIVVHSVVIGLSMGASDNPCTIRPLIAALCFHQLFEGMGLGGCILQAEYKWKTNAMMVFFFATTTPFGIALGLALSNVYSQNSPTALIVVGLLNACSAGLLNYMALVDLLAADFMGAKLQGNVKLQIWSYIAVLLGAGGMSLMAKWA